MERCTRRFGGGDASGARCRTAPLAYSGEKLLVPVTVRSVHILVVDVIVIRGIAMKLAVAVGGTMRVLVHVAMLVIMRVAVRVIMHEIAMPV